MVSISNMMEEDIKEPVFKVEEREPHSMEYRVVHPDNTMDESYKFRV